jgi:hypothetical protein
MFPNQTLYAFCFFPIHVASPVHLILFDLITWVISGKDYKSWSSS